MDFSWSDIQKELYTFVLDRARNASVLHAARSDQWWTRADWLFWGNVGLLGLSVPEQYGGKGYSALTVTRGMEAFGHGCDDLGLGFSMAAHLFACAMPIAEHGNEALKEQILPGLCSGELIGANAITEQSAGSDIFSLKTRAVRDGDFYSIQGEKSFVSNGPVADIIIVYAVTNPAHSYLGISGFVLEKDMEGLIIGEPLDKMGLLSTPACRITLRDCRVPSINRLGGEGQGSSIFKRSMQWERAYLFALYLGQMERQLEQILAYVKERKQFGVPLGKHQVVAHRLADMKLRLEAARLLLYRACWLFDQGEDANLAIAISKLAVSEAALQGGLDALHLHGAAGYLSRYGIERMLRDAIPGTIFSGTSEMQRDIIANELGL